jgi:hypothetical protein
MTEKPILKKPVARPTETPVVSLPKNEKSNVVATMTTNPRDLDRSRAKEAWDNIQIVKPQKNYQAKYGSLARKIPTLIQINGLAQTLAFLKAKNTTIKCLNIYLLGFAIAST